MDFSRDRKSMSVVCLRASDSVPVDKFGKRVTRSKAQADLNEGSRVLYVKANPLAQIILAGCTRGNFGTVYARSSRTKIRKASFINGELEKSDLSSNL